MATATMPGWGQAMIAMPVAIESSPETTLARRTRASMPEMSARETPSKMNRAPMKVASELTVQSMLKTSTPARISARPLRSRTHQFAWRARGWRNDHGVPPWGMGGLGKTDRSQLQGLAFDLAAALLADAEPGRDLLMALFVVVVEAVAAQQNFAVACRQHAEQRAQAAVGPRRARFAATPRRCQGRRSARRAGWRPRRPARRARRSRAARRAARAPCAG